MKKLSSFRKLSLLAQRMVPQAGRSTVSFDVFDTLIHRRCAPELVQWATASKFARTYNLDPASTMAVRRENEVRLRRERAAHGLDDEVSIDDWFEAWVAECLQVGRDTDGNINVRAIASDLVAYELDAEKAVCFANPAALKSVALLKSKGFRVIWISDMYLGECRIQDILDHCGYAGLFDAGYASGDFSIKKATGRLFGEVLDLENLRPDFLTHFGDNPIADGKAPRALGIRGIHIDDKGITDRNRALVYDFEKMLACPESWTGATACAFGGPTPFERLNDLEYIGRAHIGPALATFLHKLAQTAMERKLERVFFLSREGMVLQKMYEIIGRAVYGDALPQGIYLCASRFPTLLASMKRFGLREYRLSTDYSGPLSVRKLLLPMVQDEQFLLELSAKHGIDDIDQTVDPLNNPSVLKLFRDPLIEAALDYRGEEMRRGLIAHLEERGFLGLARVGLVDVGWGGQIQENIELTLEGRSDAPEIHGLYMATNEKAAARRIAGSRIDGLIVSPETTDWDGASVFSFVEAYETACRALHPTVVGYTPEGRPLFANSALTSRVAEEEDDAAIAFIQKGMVDYARLHALFLKLTRASADDLVDYARTAICTLMRFPTAPEADALLRFKHVRNHWTDEPTTFSGKRRTLNPISALKAIQSSPWKEGAAISLGGPLAQIALNFRRVLRSNVTGRPHGKSVAAPCPVPDPFPALKPMRVIPPLPIEAEVWNRAEELMVCQHANFPLRSPGSRQPLTALNSGMNVALKVLWNRRLKAKGMATNEVGVGTAKASIGRSRNMLPLKYVRRCFMFIR